MKKFENKKIMLSFLLIFSIGLALGLIFIFFINELDKSLLAKYIEEYIQNINSNKISTFNGILNSIKINILYITIIWICGIVFIFFPIIYFVIFYKGFLLGFLISSFIIIYKLKGLIYSLVFSFPHEFLNIILLLSLSILSIKFAKKVFLKIKNNESISIKMLSKKYLSIYLIYIGLSIISSFLEIFVNSFFIRLVI